jgi:hypothetical protein
MHPTLWDFACSPCAQPHAHPTLQIAFLTRESFVFLINSHNGGGHLYVPALSQIGTTHPSQGISLRFVSWRKSHIVAMIHISQVCKLENVSHSYNHQHSLLAREAFFIIPSLTQMYFELCLGWSHQHSLSTTKAFFTKLIW